MYLLRKVTFQYYIFINNLLQLYYNSKENFFVRILQEKNCKIKSFHYFKKIKLKYISNLKLKYQTIFDIPFQKKSKEKRQV